MEEKMPVSPKMKEMEIDDKLTYPIEQTRTIRTSASELSLFMMRTYKVNIDRKTRTVIVTRTA